MSPICPPFPGGRLFTATPHYDAFTTRQLMPSTFPPRPAPPCHSHMRSGTNRAVPDVTFVS